MLSVEDAGALVRIRATGVLDRSDYRQFEAEFANMIDRTGAGPFPLLLDLTGFRGWTLGGLLRDLRFDLIHRETFSCIAVVGDRDWHRWLMYAAVPIFRARLEFFGAADKRLAEAWLRRPG